MKPTTKPPLAFILTLFITSIISLFVLFYGMMSITAPETESGKWLLIVLFPIYTLLSVYLAYRAYAERRGLSYILIALVWLSAIAEVALLYQ